MKKATRKVVGLLVSVACGLVLMGGVATAQSSISNTGPDSTNIIKNSRSCEIDVTNNNNVDVTNNNSQSANSGNSSSSGNTSGGGAQTGNASNNNSTNINIGITNNSPTCIPEEPTPPAEQPEQPGGGRGAGVTTTPAVLAAAQVQAPTGGVGAGAGTGQYIGGFAVMTLLSGALAAVRFHKFMHGEA